MGGQHRADHLGVERLVLVGGAGEVPGVDQHVTEDELGDGVDEGYAKLDGLIAELR